MSAFHSQQQEKLNTAAAAAMWMKHLTITVCLIATSLVYAQRTPPTRSTPKPIALVTTAPSTTTPPDGVIGQESCRSRLLNPVGIQGNTGNVTQNYLVVTKPGRRRSFERRYPGTVIQSSPSGRGLPVTVVDDKQAKMVRY